ncbi:MAG: phosphate ABC transporter permease PstA [Gammaproteobacteria bacterium]
MGGNIKTWIDSGEPYIWLNAGAVSISILLVTGLVGMITVRGLVHFWPAAVVALDYTGQDGSITPIIGELVEHERTTLDHPGQQKGLTTGSLVGRYLVKTGNRDLSGLDFRWVDETGMGKLQHPDNVMVVERREWGNFYGYLHEIRENGQAVNPESGLWHTFQTQIRRSGSLFDRIRHTEKDLIGNINYRMEHLRLQQRGLTLQGISDPVRMKAISRQRRQLQLKYDGYTQQLARLYRQLNSVTVIATQADGKEVTIPLSKVVRAYRPNRMSMLEKTAFYFTKLWEFIAAEPRESNTEGGIFPAIFGTVIMVMIMAIMVTPFGVIAAIYLHEYARQGPLTRLIRIAVNNLAGVPSIVYGVFGLGFFVYFLGGHIDQLFFPEALPTPTFGTPGLLWASVTLALLTVPVVIVATEEGLSRVPQNIREGSLALGATKAETLWLTVLPMTAPAMITGLILAIARAAGEVAPLMLVGVVKLAPSLPLDSNYPFLHLDRKFMHLGFHIYDAGFQSPNVEAARPLVYSTALLLIAIIIILNLTAIRIRNRLREKYRAAEQY